MFSIGQALSEVTPLLDVESLSASYPELQSRGEGGSPGPPALNPCQYQGLFQ